MKNFDRALSLVALPQTTQAASFEPPQETETRYAELPEDGIQRLPLPARPGKSECTGIEDLHCDVETLKKTSL